MVALHRLLYKVLFHLGGKRGGQSFCQGAVTPLQGYNVFLTGQAGTGKTVQLKEIIQHPQVQHGVAQVGITATTGKAALPLIQWTNRTFFSP